MYTPKTLPEAGVTLSGGQPLSSHRSVRRWPWCPSELDVVLPASRVKCVEWCCLWQGEMYGVYVVCEVCEGSIGLCSGLRLGLRLGL